MIEILKGIVLIYIPVVCFSLKFPLFNIGVPIVKSSKDDTLDKYIARTAIKKLKAEALFCLQNSLIKFIVSFGITNCFLFALQDKEELEFSTLIEGIVATSGTVLKISFQNSLSLLNFSLFKYSCSEVM